jgi:hypothetical protein
VAYAALTALADQGRFETRRLPEAMRSLGLDPDGPFPPNV